MAIPTLLSRNGVTVYPATIPQAIIDPETGEPANLGSDMEYTINNQSADENGNFTITAQSLGAAQTNHTHAIANVTGLQDELDGKSTSNHTHDVVTGLTVGSTKLTGDLRIVGTGNVSCTASGNDINISITPYTTERSTSIHDAVNDDGYELFVGTQAEWDTFRQTMQNGKNYLVLIRS